MGERMILHSDCNNYYASIECLYRPELRGQPVAVCGDMEKRHGIVLAKNYLAKSAGIKTGFTIGQAKKLCPGLVIVPPNYPLYLRFSQLAREIYSEYTDCVESIGLDEAWLDVTGSTRLFGDGEKIAQQIRERMKAELGITVSIGVSFNKVFAKLGSDMKKPDAVTVISRQNYKEVVWPLFVGELLYVGQSTIRRLHTLNILTIGELAQTDPQKLEDLLGKWGYVLWVFANGLDQSSVLHMDEMDPIKSIGNSTTTPRDIRDLEDARITMCVLSESVATRLRKHGILCNTVQISVRDVDLAIIDRQKKLEHPTQTSSTIYAAAMELLATKYNWKRPLRSLGVRGADLVSTDSPQQLFLHTLAEVEQEKRIRRLEQTVDGLRQRFGHHAVQRAMMLKEPSMAINPQEHINPVRPFS